MERHGARPPAGRSLEKKRRMLKARPRVSGLQKLRTTKLNTKGRISARASHPLSGAGPWRSPRRAVPWGSFRFLPPGARPPAMRPGGRLPPVRGAPVLLHRRLAQAAPHTL